MVKYQLVTIPAHFSVVVAAASSRTMDPDGQGGSSCDKFDFGQALPDHHPARLLPRKHSASRKASSLAKCVGILNQLRDDEVDSDFVERRKKIRAGVRRNFVPGKGRSRNEKTTMLFMESGLRPSWHVAGVEGGKERYKSQNPNTES